MTTYVELGARGPVTGVPDNTGNNPGNWTVVLDPNTFNISTQIQYFEIYKMIVHGAAGSAFSVYVDINQWDTNVFGQANSWDPIQPLKVQQGQYVYFYYSDAVTDGTPPVVTVWVRYDRDLLYSGGV
jgi:hypothetical protein